VHTERTPTKVLVLRAISTSAVAPGAGYKTRMPSAASVASLAFKFRCCILQTFSMERPANPVAEERRNSIENTSTWAGQHEGHASKPLPRLTWVSFSMGILVSMGTYLYSPILNNCVRFPKFQHLTMYRRLHFRVRYWANFWLP
jgi:hypothetical protein